MNRILARAVAGALALGFVSAGPVSAHAGHAGDHGFLYAALQPLLAPDHLVAGLTIAVAGGLICALAAGVVRRSRRISRS